MKRREEEGRGNANGAGEAVAALRRGVAIWSSSAAAGGGMPQQQMQGQQMAQLQQMQAAQQMAMGQQQGGYPAGAGGAYPNQQMVRSPT